MKICDAVFLPVLVTKASVPNYPCVFIATFEHYLHMKHSIFFRIVFIKKRSTFLDLFTVIFLLYSDCSKCGRLFFLTLTSSNSKVYSVILLKFSTKQINLITKKSVPTIWEIMNINVDFRIFVNASHSVFLKKH